MSTTEKEYCCYLLANNLNKRTYVGVTINMRKRFRQHSKIIKQGAKYTSMLPESGRWYPICVVTGFQNKTQALQFEYCMKQKMNKYRNNHLDKNTLKKIRTICKNTEKPCPRVVQLLQTLSLSNWTTKAISSDQVSLTVIWYTDRTNSDRHRPRSFESDFLQSKRHLSEKIHLGIINDYTIQIHQMEGEEMPEIVYNPPKGTAI